MRRYLSILILFGFALFITGCDIINPEEPIPSYLEIPAFTLTTDFATQGTNSHNITEAHVFVANELIGIFTLPATIPVLVEGTQDVQVFPSIRVNGLGGITDIYPFYERYQTTVDFVVGNVVTVNPTTNYLENVKFFFEPQEGFEDPSLTFAVDLDGDTATTIELTNLDVFEGNSSAVIELEKSDPQMEVGSNIITELPPSGSISTFLELNYKTEASFLVGVLGYDSQGRTIYSFVDKGVNPRDEWNKIYFDLTQEMVDLISLDDQLAGWRLVLVSDLFDESPDQASIYLDNIKLVQFR